MRHRYDISVYIGLYYHDAVPIRLSHTAGISERMGREAHHSTPFSTEIEEIKNM